MTTYLLDLMRVRELFGIFVGKQIKVLIESKHLYQNVEVDLKDFASTPDMQYFNLEKLPGFGLASMCNWQIVDPNDRRSIYEMEDLIQVIRFRVPDVKLNCVICDRIEAFNLFSVSDILNRSGSSPLSFESNDRFIQIFAISFLCQSCKSVPEVFLVRRHGMKLTICGRAPIEYVDVPKILPKELRRFYSDAVVAHDSGQTLAGLFFLRTIIEQWVRQQVSDFRLQGDQANDKYIDKYIEMYMDILPIDFKNRFISLKKVYSDISADIHSAIGSPELFDASQRAIIEHFQARRLFKIK
jgi:hypothetical protein